MNRSLVKKMEQKITVKSVTTFKEKSNTIVEL